MKTHSLLRAAFVLVICIPPPLGLRSFIGGVHAQSPAWLIGNEVIVQPTTAAPALSSVALPQPNDGNIDPDLQYQGQVAQWSQCVQLDDQGRVLFSIIDGRLYDRAGYLVADAWPNGGAAGLFQGVTEVVAYAVPGRCGLWYIVSSATGTLSAEYDLEFAVLDMTLDNPLFSDPSRKGALLDIDDAEAIGFNPLNAWSPHLPNGFSLNPDPYTNLPKDPWPVDKSGAVHYDVVYNQAVDRHFLFATTDWYVAAYEITGDDFVYLFTMQGLGGEGVRNAKGEAEAISVGSEVLFAFTTFITVPGGAQLGVRQLRFDATDPGLAQIGLAQQYHVYDAVGLQYPVDVNGEPIITFRIGGLEYAPNGQYLYWWMPNVVNGPASLGYIDLSNNTMNNLVTTAPEFFDSELELGTAPGAGNYALYLCGRDALGNARLGALLGPNDPNTAVWQPNVYPLNAVCLAGEMFGGEPYYLLCAQVFDDPSAYVLATPPCCDALFASTSLGSFAAGMGTQTWLPTSNPFGNVPIVRVEGELRIPMGAHITVSDMEFRFGPGGNLVIEPGASFTCNNCLLGPGCPDNRWLGVEVLGIFGQHQFGGGHADHQGEFVMVNSVVENAEIGALTGARLGNGYNGLKSGGVILCTNSTFRNCREAVHFLPYQGSNTQGTIAMRNRSRFIGTTFSVDADYPVPIDFKYHAYLWQVDGIPFLGCTFNNLRTTETDSHQLGHCIYSLDANYEVREKCNVIIQQGQECPEGSYTPSVFTGLDHGIHALNSFTKRAFVVDRCAFHANVFGVYASGVVGYRVTRSAFTLGNSRAANMIGDEDEMAAPYHRGLYSFRCYGFTVEDNALAQAGTHTQTEGIVIGYSDAHNDVVRRNTATGLERAYIGEGICADVNGFQTNFIGLQYLCNTNVGNLRDFWDRKVTMAPGPEQPLHTMRTIQGGLNSPGANVFDQQGVDPEGDYKRTSNNGVLNYIYGASVSDEPYYYTLGLVAKQQCSAVPANLCPTRNYRPRGYRNATDAVQAKAQVLDEKLAYGSTRYLYDQLIDGGSTDEVVLEIQSSWPEDAWELRAYLLGHSPYLSFEVLESLVERNALPAAMLAEVLIANPEATQQNSFLHWLQVVSGHPLPQYLSDAVEASWAVKTYRYTLEAQMGDQHAAMTQHAHDLAAYWSNDTLYEDVDSLRATWQLVRTPAARYAEVLTHMQQGNYAAATAVMEGIVTEHTLRAADELERQRMLSILELCTEAFGPGRIPGDLTTGELDALEAIVDGAHDRPAVWARNVLCFVYGRCSGPLTGGEEGAPQLYHAPRAEPGGIPLLVVLPNPASTWVAFNMAMNTAPRQAMLQVRDVLGRLVWRSDVTAVEEQLIWDCHTVEAGSYTVEMMNAGGSVATAQFIIQR